VNKEEYLRECLKRNPKLRENVLIFHHQFPPVFSREDKKNEAIPDWINTILEPSGLKDTFGNDLYIGRPKRFEDLEILGGPRIQEEGFRIHVVGEGKNYWEALNKEPWEYGRELRKLRKAWPGIAESTFLHGIFEPYMPVVLILSDREEWKKESDRIGGKVKIFVPIYEDTSKDNINWDYIEGLQDLYYGKKHRSRPDKYEIKLKIWDKYQELKNYAAVAKELRLPRTTVEETYVSVYKDIIGTSLKGKKLRDKRAAGTPKNHFQECTKCKCATRFEDMCPAGRALVNQDQVSQRELTVGGSPEAFNKSRGKRAKTSDEYFKEEGESLMRSRWKESLNSK